MRAAACLRRPAVHLFSSSQGPAPPRLGRLLHHHFRGASSPSPAASPWSWQQQTASSLLIPRSSPRHVPSRSFRSGSAPTATAKRHLYVVLVKDSESGFDIHKLDMDDDDLDGEMGALPETPAVRFTGNARWTQFAALGNNIVGTGLYPWPAHKGVTTIYDTKMAELATSDLVPSALYNYSPDRAVAARDTLYVFESKSHNYRGCPACEVHFPGGLHCLRADAAAEEEDKLWKWRALPNSPRFSWSCNDPIPELPFDAQSITSYAVHPRGHTLFVSAGGWKVDAGTFTYGTESGKWKRRGYWELPFIGPGHYDAQLDAWVGFHRLTEETTDGHLCACRVTSAASASRQPPECKVSKEALLLEEDMSDWSGSHEGRLVYMAGRGEYCLMEHLPVKDMLRLSMFRVKYGDDGELTTTAHRPARSYELPGDDISFYTVFWM